ncbi:MULTISPECIES: hypothetical protein [unclassified Cupriavidus]|uniref:hypothetical protein n=1 Tax=Cupriavidus sp. H19C3 TaxID=3241603 RepID=UPI003BF859DD
MDGIYFVVLLGFGALTGALLALCAALGTTLPPGGGESDAHRNGPGATRAVPDQRGQ